MEDETMARPEITGRKTEQNAAVIKKKGKKSERQRRPLPPRQPGDDYTVQEFCRKRRFTESFFHKLRSLGLGPKVRQTGARVTISEQADGEWQPPTKDEITAASAAAGI
jgi:hypothetical protein